MCRMVFCDVLKSRAQNFVTATLLLGLMLLSPLGLAQEQEQAHVDDSVQIMEAFNQDAMAEQEAYALKDEDKHKILFYMGVSLLVLLCATAYFGISMVVFNQEVFVRHMICAGLTVTLGIAHAVAAAVWFFPF